MTTALLLFRRDLRLADNPALAAACAEHTHILPVFIQAPHDDDPWPAGAASRWWLHHSLAALQSRLQSRRGRLHLASGDTLQVLLQLLQQSGARAVYWNRLYEPGSIARDTRVKAALRERGIEVHSHRAALWSEPWQVSTQQGEPYRVFTPYWRNLRARLNAALPLPEPDVPHWLTLSGNLPLPALGLLPRSPWHAGLAESWQPGEKGAQDMLEVFCDDAVRHYAQSRDLPARHGTSRLSPHLHFGEISPRQIHFTLQAQEQRAVGRQRPDIEPYLRELGWREFAHHLLYHFPHTPTHSFNSRFDNFPWAAPDEAQLARWQQGRTGFPLVDAGMRELWHTGWMHNRVRMIAASFLVKNLRQHWLHGARWFWDTLVDADLANNTLGWQWVAGCGADAAPYFRVFNPLTQARKFDPDGAYVKRWLPELAHAPLDVLHEPWKDRSFLVRSGYPAPMLDLALSRQDSLDAYHGMRGGGLSGAH